MHDRAQITAIPLGVQQAMESEQCVLFVGSGIGRYARDSKGNEGPDGATLAGELARHFGIDTEGNFDLSKVAELVELRKGRTELETFVKSRLSGLEPDDTVRWLFSQRWKAI